MDTVPLADPGCEPYLSTVQDLQARFVVPQVTFLEHAPGPYFSSRPRTRSKEARKDTGFAFSISLHFSLKFNTCPIRVHVPSVRLGCTRTGSAVSAGRFTSMPPTSAK